MSLSALGKMDTAIIVKQRFIGVALEPGILAWL